MKHDVEIRELHYQRVLWETQTYLREVLEENDRLRRAMVGLEAETGRLRGEKNRLEHQLMPMLERLAMPSTARHSPRIRLVWND